ncbi:hypothetical protein AB833_26245 [Chromatiales bacterium (ex Bugula neritina AB1)]|nr:hypothetical protein AB833_26245 [Chromatiales bacterium (ex Bugula neritina AB1)]
MNISITHATDSSENTGTIDLNNVMDSIIGNGYCLLRGYSNSLEQFSTLINRLCKSVTYDPARSISAESVQKVDAGVEAIGLHIENGNTPRVPHLLGFYCRKAASSGSQTTICDGSALLDQMPAEIRSPFDQHIVVTRTLSEEQWKSYLAQEHPEIHSADQVKEIHLKQMLAMHDDHSATLNADSSLTYKLTIDPVRRSPFSANRAFANAVLGPSFNYQPPEYRLASGEILSKEQIENLREFAEARTGEIAWHDSDILLLDNWRMMHGRRAITDAANRELFIGMGMVQ